MNAAAKRAMVHSLFGTVIVLALVVVMLTLAGCATDRASTGKERREFITQTVPSIEGAS